MIAKFRQSLNLVGGFQVVVAFAAIGWGLNRLQQVASERQEHLDALAADCAEQGEELRRIVQYRNLLAADEPRVDRPMKVEEVFEQDDLDPLGRGSSDV